MRHVVLLVSLGPIQEFIASARRCRDLWFGSWLLSELARTAATAMVEFAGGERQVENLIFPGATGLASLQRPETSVSNRILMRVHGDREQVRKTAEAGRNAVIKRLKELSEEAFSRVGKGDPNRSQHFHEAKAIAQVEDLIEYVWVAAAEKEGENAYAEARTEAERRMTAVKNTKVWCQPGWAEDGVPKSSLDGVRESVLDERIFDTSVVPGVKSAGLNPEQRRLEYGVHGSERLCGVGLLKRHGRMIGQDGSAQAEAFLSSSHMACLPWMVGVERNPDRLARIEECWQTFLAGFPGSFLREEFRMGANPRNSIFDRTDGGLLFESRLTQVLREREVSPEQEARHLRRQRDVLQAADIGAPNPYYAILVADGDRMGAVINAQTSFGTHRELSISLEKFARQASVVVEAHEGCLIYAGGDDVLALLPMHSALACVQTLARSFKEHMAYWKTEKRETATLSAGLAVVHHLLPLDIALGHARDAEKTAKHDAGRNALALTVAPRGGSSVTIYGHWDDLAPRLELLTSLRRQDQISNRAGYELRALQRLEPAKDPEAQDTLRKIQHLEAMRILTRKKAEKGGRQLSPSTLKTLEDMLQNVSPDILGRELYVAEQLAQAQIQARETDTHNDEEVRP